MDAINLHVDIRGNDGVRSIGNKRRFVIQVPVSGQSDRFESVACEFTYYDQGLRENLYFFLLEINPFTKKKCWKPIEFPPWYGPCVIWKLGAREDCCASVGYHDEAYISCMHIEGLRQEVIQHNGSICLMEMQVHLKEVPVLTLKHIAGDDCKPIIWGNMAEHDRQLRLQETYKQCMLDDDLQAYTNACRNYYEPDFKAPVC